MIRCHDVECWLLCNEFEFVMIKDDVDTGKTFRKCPFILSIYTNGRSKCYAVCEKKLILKYTVKSAFTMPLLENTSKKLTAS